MVIGFFSINNSIKPHPINREIEMFEYGEQFGSIVGLTFLDESNRHSHWGFSGAMSRPFQRFGADRDIVVASPNRE